MIAHSQLSSQPSQLILPTEIIWGGLFSIKEYIFTNTFFDFLFFPTCYSVGKVSKLALQFIESWQTTTTVFSHQHQRETPLATWLPKTTNIQFLGKL